MKHASLKWLLCVACLPHTASASLADIVVKCSNSESFDFAGVHIEGRPALLPADIVVLAMGPWTDIGEQGGEEFPEED